MCHNLGADYTKDPFVPSADIHGDKYQWGYKNPIIKQKDDVYWVSDVNGWSWNRIRGKAWNNGVDDPCPAGYRVPTGAEWSAVHKYNEKKKLGLWRDSGNLKVDDGGVKLGEHLILPVAGKRFQNVGTVDQAHLLGTTVEYWSSTLSQHSILLAGSYGLFAHDGNPDGVNYGSTLYDAIPVRCIKK